MPLELFAIIAFILGASIGSFIAARTYRITHNLPLDSFGRSYCPSCKKHLRARDLVPMLSFLIKKGRCSFCHKPFSSFYFWVEFLLGLFFLWCTYWILGPIIETVPTFNQYIELLFLWTMGGMFLYITLIDIALLEFPVIGLSLLSILLVILSGLTNIPNSLQDSLLGGVILVAFFMAVRMIGRWVYKKEVMGEGDLYLAGLIGLATGLTGSIISLYIAAISSTASKRQPP